MGANNSIFHNCPPTHNKTIVITNKELRVTRSLNPR